METVGQVIRAQDFQNGYVAIAKAIAEHGERVSPRGQATREFQSATIILEDVTHAIPIDVGRKLNMGVGAAETAQLVAGLSDLGQLASVTKRFRDFSDDGSTLKGAYGPRIYQQMPNVIERLVADPDTRQAGATIWRPTDLAEDSKDVPCTVQLMWHIRDGKLDMSTTMRSNDIFLGSAYDFWMFTRLQMSLAWALGIPTGKYVHHALSLHVYERDLPAVEKLEYVPEGSFSTPPFGFGTTKQRGDLKSLDQALARWRAVRARAARAVLGRLKFHGTPGLVSESAQWYIDTLEPHRSNGIVCRSCRYVFPREQEFWYAPLYYEGSLENSGKCVSCRKSEYQSDLDKQERDKQRRFENRCRQYGITTDEYDAMLAEQGGVCAVCKAEPDNGRWLGFCIDYDHMSGEPRGLLCSKDNHAIGLLDDSPSRARNIAEYLESPPFARVQGKNRSKTGA